MRKGTTYLTIIAVLFGGLLMLYRYSLNSSNLTRVDGKILTKKRESVSTHKGSKRYGLIFEIENAEDKYGMYIGTANHIENTNNLFRLIDTGKIYTLLIDPTVSSRNGLRLGVREIYFDGKLIFKESNRFELVVGIFFTLLGISGLIVLTRANKTK